ncbi:MAG: hypothetical protein JWM10_730 [Myxococcaceae bacterium]|nr:hypothetical protein [Myxococcaceae bacterium]
MSYDLLLSLYYADASNADLTTQEERELLHVRTPVEGRITAAIRDGFDVVLTGNPGDGKSHLVRTLGERGDLVGAEVLLDLSAIPTGDAIARWKACRAAKRRFVMCANEGPLRSFNEVASADEALNASAWELRQQLAHRVESGEVPTRPARALLINLADRNVLSEPLIADAVARVCRDAFVPDVGVFSAECSAARNMLLLQQDAPRRRFAQLLALAGTRRGEHVTFRRLWQAISLGVTGGRTVAKLKDESKNDADGPLGASPIDNLARRAGRGVLVEAVRRFADPACFTDPDLDESLWHTGAPPSGEWLCEEPSAEHPATMWAMGRRDDAIDQLKRLKRLVALAHERGDELVRAMTRATARPSAVEPRALLDVSLRGIRRLYLSQREDANAPEWLRSGLPLWVGFSYEQAPVEERPHVAVVSLPEDEFELVQPTRPEWLGDALGPLPERAWLRHRRSSTLLRIDPEMLAALKAATESSGPLPIPEPVHRFLAQLAGWDELHGERPLGDEAFAVLSRPRGELEVDGRVRLRVEGASYV